MCLPEQICRFKYPSVEPWVIRPIARADRMICAQCISQQSRYFTKQKPRLCQKDRQYQCLWRIINITILLTGRKNLNVAAWLMKKHEFWIFSSVAGDESNTIYRIHIPYSFVCLLQGQCIWLYFRWETFLCLPKTLMIHKGISFFMLARVWGGSLQDTRRNYVQNLPMWNSSSIILGRASRSKVWGTVEA